MLISEVSGLFVVARKDRGLTMIQAVLNSELSSSLFGRILSRILRYRRSLTNEENTTPIRFQRLVVLGNEGLCIPLWLSLTHGP